MKVLMLGAGAAALASIAIGASRPLAPVRFEARPGWHVGSNRVHACPGVPRSRCEQVTSWAATVRWRDCGDCVPPRKTLARLPAGGIAIQLMLSRETRRVHRRRFAWPPRITARDRVGPGLEGGPRWIGFVSKSGRLGEFDAALWVFFGRPHPTARQVARANAELRTAKLP